MPSFFEGELPTKISKYPGAIFPFSNALWYNIFGYFELKDVGDDDVAIDIGFGNIL